MLYNEFSFFEKQYNPKTLALMLSQQCNAECNHCVVESTKEKSPLLDKNLIQSALKNAIKHEISNVLIYGGEPFLQYKDLLPYSIEESFKE